MKAVTPSTLVPWNRDRGWPSSAAAPQVPSSATSSWRRRSASGSRSGRHLRTQDLHETGAGRLQHVRRDHLGVVGSDLWPPRASTCRPDVVQRGIDSYVLHMDVGTVRIDPPGHEKRIAAVHRGCGPRGVTEQRWAQLRRPPARPGCKRKGARVHDERVDGDRLGGRQAPGSTEGRQPVALRPAGGRGRGQRPGPEALRSTRRRTTSPPKTTKTFICEFLLGEEIIERYLGQLHARVPARHAPAGIRRHRSQRRVRDPRAAGQGRRQGVGRGLPGCARGEALLPAGLGAFPEDFCRCFPSINVQGSPQPFADRVVFIGDCGESRLYKDGIGGAYRTAKAAAKTAVFEGVSAEDFRRHYLPVCRGAGDGQPHRQGDLHGDRVIQAPEVRAGAACCAWSRERAVGGGRPTA